MIQKNIIYLAGEGLKVFFNLFLKKKKISQFILCKKKLKYMFMKLVWLYHPRTYCGKGLHDVFGTIVFLISFRNLRCHFLWVYIWLVTWRYLFTYPDILAFNNWRKWKHRYPQYFTSIVMGILNFIFFLINKLNKPVIYNLKKIK